MVTIYVSIYVIYSIYMQASKSQCLYVGESDDVTTRIDVHSKRLRREGKRLEGYVISGQPNRSAVSRYFLFFCC